MDICVIGGSNIDIAGLSKNKAILHDSNIGEIYFTPGGVGRNIAENLARLGSNTKLVTAFGNDFYASKLIDSCKELKIDIEDSLIVEDGRTSSYLFIADNDGDMLCAINDMAIYEKLDVEFLKTKIDVINQCNVCVFDTNIGINEIEYLCKNVTIPIFVDPVSIEKGKKILPFLDKVTGFKPNLLEAKEFTNTSCLEDASKALLDKGVKNIFISLGSKGLYYANSKCSGIVKALDIEVVNATGAGDCLSASLAYAYNLGYNIDSCASFGVSASQLCIISEETVSKEICFKKVKEIEKKIEIKRN